MTDPVNIADDSTKHSWICQWQDIGFIIERGSRQQGWRSSLSLSGENIIEIGLQPHGGRFNPKMMIYHLSAYQFVDIMIIYIYTYIYTQYIYIYTIYHDIVDIILSYLITVQDLDKPQRAQGSAAAGDHEVLGSKNGGIKIGKMVNVVWYWYGVISKKWYDIGMI